MSDWPIHKLTPNGPHQEVPGEPLSFANQYNAPTLWYLANDVPHWLYVRVTGSPAPSGARFIGTALLDDGRLVLHAFAKAKP